MKSKLARLRLAALVAVGCTLSTAFAADQYRVFTLTWVPPTQNEDGSPLTDLQGYYVYMGESPETLEIRYFTGAERVAVGWWGTGARYFAVSALNVDGVESEFIGVLEQPAEVIE
jgi:hypothetical protein